MPEVVRGRDITIERGEPLLRRYGGVDPMNMVIDLGLLGETLQSLFFDTLSLEYEMDIIRGDLEYRGDPDDILDLFPGSHGIQASDQSAMTW